MIKTYLLALALLVPAISAVPVPVREGTTLDSSSFLSRAGLRRATEIVDTPTLETVGLAHGANQKTTSPTSTATPHGLLKRSYPSILQRASDDETAGGNAYSGRTGDVDSGNVNNITGEGGTITNAGLGSKSFILVKQPKHHSSCVRRQLWTGWSDGQRKCYWRRRQV